MACFEEQSKWKGHDEARQQFELAKLPANDDAASAELDRAIKAADAAYHAKVARLGQEHAVRVR